MTDPYYGPEGVSDWFRSDTMEYLSMVIQESCGNKVLSKLGRLGAVQFTDLNAHHTLSQRRYVNEVTRCEAVERKLKFFEEELAKYDIPARQVSVSKYFESMDQRGEEGFRFSSVEGLVDEKQAELLELNSYSENLTREYMAQCELRCVLSKVREYASSGGGPSATAATGSDVESGNSRARGGASRTTTRDEQVDNNSMRFRFIVGVVDTKLQRKMQTQVFRATRGNCLMNFYAVDQDEFELPNEIGGDKEGTEVVNRTVFLFLFQGSMIEDKIRRITAAYSARIYDVPDLGNLVEIEQRAQSVFADIQDRSRVLNKNKNLIIMLLADVSKYIESWRFISLREKAIYHSMNMFASDVQGVLRAEGWVLQARREEVLRLVEEAHLESAGGGARQTLPSSVSIVPSEQWPGKPPTFFKTNNFTNVYQVIIDTYGVPRYKEANPALLAAIMFPFSFGIMFGDIGHGTLLLIASLVLLYKAKEIEKMGKSKGELLEILYAGRYMLVLNGIFGTYCGFIYNDFFAMGLEIWPTRWAVGNVTGDVIGFTVDTELKVYPFGVDPTWHRASNNLLYMNSLKMKMAVIFGVVQMTFGLFHRIQNALYFEPRIHKNLDLWFEAVPMVVFMTALFGYMCLLILIKWSMQWVWTDCVTDPITGMSNATGCSRENCCNPPMLITQLINIALKPGEVPKGQQVYDGQGGVQAILILVAVLMLPLMLIPKPYFLIKRMKAMHPAGRNGDAGPVSDRRGSHNSHTELMLGDNDRADMDHGDHEEHKEGEESHSSGDIIIHQVIETIEFTLGCISNTASYLRLWALSLAHSQLASVFLTKALFFGIKDTGATGVLVTFAAYAAFAVISFGVLLCMDNLECFLHALRLQWVEFQSKFLKGDGYAFVPLSFRTTLSAY